MQSVSQRSWRWVRFEMLSSVVWEKHILLTLSAAGCARLAEGSIAWGAQEGRVTGRFARIVRALRRLLQAQKQGMLLLALDSSQNITTLEARMACASLARLAWRRYKFSKSLAAPLFFSLINVL